MADDILQCLTDDNISKLLKVLENEMPLSSPVCNWIRVQTHWKAKITSMKVDIMCPNGDWSKGIVVGLCRNLMSDNKVYGVIYTHKDKVKQLEDALRLTNLIPWNDIAIFTVVYDYITPILTNLMSEKTNMKPISKVCNLQYMTAEKAALICPANPGAGVRVTRLQPHDVDEVCGLWPHFSECYRPVIRAMVDHNLSVGLFVTRADGTEQLAAMVLEAEFGGLGILQTLPEYEGRGYGSLVLLALTRDMGQVGTDPHLTVLSSNYKVLKLVKKYGYQVIGISSSVVLNY